MVPELYCTFLNGVLPKGCVGECSGYCLTIVWVLSGNGLAAIEFL